MKSDCVVCASVPAAARCSRTLLERRQWCARYAVQSTSPWNQVVSCLFGSAKRSRLSDRRPRCPSVVRCGVCRTDLAYPTGAPAVVCGVCNTVLQTPQAVSQHLRKRRSSDCSCHSGSDIIDTAGLSARDTAPEASDNCSEPVKNRLARQVSAQHVPCGAIKQWWRRRGSEPNNTPHNGGSRRAPPHKLLKTATFE